MYGVVVWGVLFGGVRFQGSMAVARVVQMFHDLVVDVSQQDCDWLPEHRVLPSLKL